MRLAELYTLRFHYPDGWAIALTGNRGKEEHHFYLAEGTCTGRIAGKFRGSNHPRRRTDDAFAMNLQGFIETEAGATIMVDYRGYGRSRARSDALYAAANPANPAAKFRRQVVGFARHLTDAPSYSWLNDSIAAVAGEVRTPPDIPSDRLKQSDVQLVFRVDELIWEAPPE